jgi:DNA repair protein RadC
MKYASFRRITSVAEASPFEQVKIQNPMASVEYARQFYHEDLVLYESFFIIMLNRANKTIAYAKISQGGVSATVVDPKIVCKLAVDSLCSGVILVHNHPSGNKDASQPDKDLTKKISQALSYLDIDVIDHIILTEESFLSFREEGLL